MSWTVNATGTPPEIFKQVEDDANKAIQEIEGYEKYTARLACDLVLRILREMPQNQHVSVGIAGHGYFITLSVQ